ncbi:MAG: porin [Thermodesulfobacteriota bacterium]
MVKKIYFMVAALLLATTSSLAAASSSGADASEKDGLAQAWARMTLYENSDNTLIKKIALGGRLQLDNVWVNGHEPNENFSDLTWRRARFGLVANLSADINLVCKGDFQPDNELGDMYQKLTDAYIAWQPAQGPEIKILKQSAGFTLDGRTSSTKLQTLERNNLTGNLWFTEEYFTGVSVAGKAGGQGLYKVGLFASDGHPEIGIDDAGWFAILSLGYQTAKGQVILDYLYQHEDEKANTSNFEQVLSLSGSWEEGAWGLRGDLAFGAGYAELGQSDVWGAVVQPSYSLSAHTQAVAQYTFLASSGDNGLSLHKYDNKIVTARGDGYNELYGGINVYFYDHRCKWQTGLAWAKMDDEAADGGAYEGVTLSTGLRLYW